MRRAGRPGGARRAGAGRDIAQAEGRRQADRGRVAAKDRDSRLGHDGSCFLTSHMLMRCMIARWATRRASTSSLLCSCCIRDRIMRSGCSCRCNEREREREREKERERERKRQTDTHRAHGFFVWRLRHPSPAAGDTHLWGCERCARYVSSTAHLPACAGGRGQRVPGIQCLRRGLGRFLMGDAF